MPKRCKWVNLQNPTYVQYHDTEWGVPHYDDRDLFEALALETFQAGLSWECVLNKREALRKAFDNFDYAKVSQYDAGKVQELCETPAIIRNKRKIGAVINNAKVFINIRKEFETFATYIWGFTEGKVIKNLDDRLPTTSELSDQISADLKRRGMTFVGSTTIYSYLQAIGVIDDHEIECHSYR